VFYKENDCITGVLSFTKKYTQTQMSLILDIKEGDDMAHKVPTVHKRMEATLKRYEGDLITLT